MRQLKLNLLNVMILKAFLLFCSFGIGLCCFDCSNGYPLKYDGDRNEEAIKEFTRTHLSTIPVIRKKQDTLDFIRDVDVGKTGVLAIIDLNDNELVQMFEEVCMHQYMTDVSCAFVDISMASKKFSIVKPEVRVYPKATNNVHEGVVTKLSGIHDVLHFITLNRHGYMVYV